MKRFYLIARTEACHYAHGLGADRETIQKMMAVCDNTHIDAAMMIASNHTGVPLPSELKSWKQEWQPPPVGGELEAVFDGHILQAILAWIQSPTGQAFLKALFVILSMLIAL